MNEQRTYSILGAARSGIAVAKLLLSEGASVFVSDAKPLETAQNAASALDALGIGYEFGGHTNRVLEADVLVLSPGVPDTIPIVREARERSMEITNELEIASQRCKGELIAITGTNGKTTTTELIGHIFRSANRKTFVGGNIGYPLSEVAPQTSDDCVVVVEVSSFQLEHVSRFKPHVALLLNVRPNHLDRYESFGDYAMAKYRITMNQTADDVLVVNSDDEMAMSILQHSSARVLEFSLQHHVGSGAFLQDGKMMLRKNAGHDSEEIIEARDVRIRGWHNLYNAMAASLAAVSLGVPNNIINDALKSFAGVPHRLEVLRTLDGVRYINDSKSTTVDSLWWALQGFEEKIVLIAGGRGKKNDYSSLIPLIDKHVKAAVLIGDAQEEMTDAFGGHTRVEQAGYDLKEALRMARSFADPGDVVLFSPACASFDMFENFEQRGDRFKDLVNGLTTSAT